MKGYSLLDDSKHHFMLQAPNGAKVKVAKAGLSKDTMSKIQGFAKGGKVEYSASPTNVLNPEAAEAFKKGFAGKPEEAPKPQMPPKKVAQFFDGGRATANDQMVESAPQQPADPQQMQPQAPVVVNVNGGGAGQSQHPAPHSAADLMPLLEAAFQKGQQSSPQQQSTPMGSDQVSHMPMPGMESQASAPAPQASATKTSAAANPMSNLLATPGAAGQASMQPANLLQQVSQNERTPTSNQASAISQYQKGQKDTVDQLDSSNEDLDEAMAGYKTVSDVKDKVDFYNQRLKKNTELGDKVRDAIDRFEFKPKHIFASNGVSWRNIGTALSVLAGGVSQGLMGSKTNPVIDYIDKNIERDTEQQKLEYGKLENRYSMLRKEGLDDRAASAQLNLEKYHSVIAMLHANEQKTKNLQAKNNIQQSALALQLQADALTKQVTNNDMLRRDLQERFKAGGGLNLTNSQPQSVGSQMGMLPASNNVGGGAARQQSSTAKGAPAANAEAFEEIAKRLPRLVTPELQKEVPEGLKEVQRLRDAHEAVPKMLKLFDQIVAHRSEKRNIVREQSGVSALIQTALPFIRGKEGAVREFEEKILRHTLPGFFDKADIDISTKRKAFIDFMQNGATSSLLDGMQIPYPKMKLGGEDY